jgi:hypothetical protein
MCHVDCRPMGWIPRVEAVDLIIRSRDGGESRTITPGLVTLLLGPNNSGKSLALREIESLARGADPATTRLVAGLRLQPPDTATDLLEFLDSVAVPAPQGIATHPGPSSVRRYLPRFSFDPPGSAMPGVPGPAVVDLGSDPDNVQPPLYSKEDWIRSQILGPLTIRLDGQARLTLTESRQASDLRQPASDHITALLRNDDARGLVRSKVFAAFGFWLVIDPTHAPNIGFAAANREPPPGVERSLNDESLTFFDQHTTPLHEFSDGVRGYVGQLAGVASLPARLLLIDEPEAFLHPPLARRLARDLCELAGNRAAQLIVATHSSDFVLGCLDVATDPALVRLDYSDGRATARTLPAAVLRRLTRDPLLRSTPAMRAPFHRAAVVVEGESDRVFYEEINRRLSSQQPAGGLSDALFINAQNWTTQGRIAGPLREIGVPAAMIVDFDAILRPAEDWRSLVNAVQLRDDDRLRLAQERDAVATALRRRIDAGELSKAELKARGVRSLRQGTERETVCRLIVLLREEGLFVVPEGELEGWLRSLNVNARKDRWLEVMLDRLGEDPSDVDFVTPSEGDVWDFLRSIAAWAKAWTAERVESEPVDLRG